ncbi:hypothetical protein [uncultured Croceitalea sp.]|uniref:hypothetical protein n=1 Tax=uncultured Croceitalea sp. TaxID=1798908 RepID=UPI00330617E0
MNKRLKILLSIPSILILCIIPYNFFSDLNGSDYDMIFNGLVVIQILCLIGLIYILAQLWRNESESRNNNWTWTLLMIFCIQPITTLVYLWAVEPKKKGKGH